MFEFVFPLGGPVRADPHETVLDVRWNIFTMAFFDPNGSRELGHLPPFYSNIRCTPTAPTPWVRGNTSARSGRLPFSRERNDKGKRGREKEGTGVKNANHGFAAKRSESCCAVTQGAALPQWLLLLPNRFEVAQNKVSKWTRVSDPFFVRSTPSFGKTTTKRTPTRPVFSPLVIAGPFLKCFLSFYLSLK